MTASSNGSFPPNESLSEASLSFNSIWSSSAMSYLADAKYPVEYLVKEFRAGPVGVESGGLRTIKHTLKVILGSPRNWEGQGTVMQTSYTTLIQQHIGYEQYDWCSMEIFGSGYAVRPDTWSPGLAHHKDQRQATVLMYVCWFKDSKTLLLTGWVFGGYSPARKAFPKVLN